MELDEKKVSPSVNQKVLKDEYEKFYDIRLHIANEIREKTETILSALNSNPVITSRIKNFPSFFSKYLQLLKNGSKKPKISDLIGIRIICPFIEDLSVTEDLIRKNFTVTEIERKGHYTFKEFGYESTHLLIKLPKEFIAKHGKPGTDIAEVQIRTILQDAWAEVEHELVYKAEFSPFDEPMRRKLAAVNASLSLADIIFQEIRSYQRKYSRELEKRRESFFHKIEESTDDLLFTEEQQIKEPDTEKLTSIPKDNNNFSIDDLLVNALTAHNQNKFSEAIAQYTSILDLEPGEEICSIIYKHRGMANFACSQYNEAVEDFNKSLSFDKKSYKAAYYRGVVRSVLKEYAAAIDDYTLSLSINPYQPFCLFRRGQAFYHIGDYPMALSDCENALALEPTNESTAKFRDILHEKLKM